MLCVRERLSDPTPANGRLAWIHHQQGKKEEARNELASLLRAVPSYLWGWMVLHDALVADQAWDDARTIFISTPTELQRSEEHTSELQSRLHLVCRLLLEK